MVEGEDSLHLYETYGEDEKTAQLRNKDQKVWTLIEEDGVQVLVPGYKHINRLNYVVTTVAYPQDEVPKEVVYWKGWLWNV